MTDLTNGDDTYDGGSGDDIINALDGNDIVHGNDGDDQINGGSGNDQLYGDAGDDQLNGGSGDDRLVGGTGNDILIGGSGIDTAVINANGANGIGSHNGGTLTVTTVDGQDELTQMEFIQFNNGTVAIVNGNAQAYLGADTDGVTQVGTVSKDVAHGVLANDFDIDDTMTLTGIHSNNVNSDGTLGTALTGGYGALTLYADGSYSYTANANTVHLGVGETATDVFTYSVLSGGTTSTQTITIVVTGTNDAPTFTSSVQTPTYNDTTGDDTFTTFTGTLNSSDPDTHDTPTYGIQGEVADSSQVGFDHKVTGAYGTLYINETSGAYEYVTNDAAMEAAKTTVSDSFTFTVNDGHGGTDTQSFVVTVNGVNDTPTLGAITSMSYQDTAADDTFLTQSGTLNGADRDNDPLTYHATGETSDNSQTGFDHAVTGTYGTLYFNASNGAYEYVPNDGAIEALKTTASETFSFTASDGTLSSVAQMLTVTLNGVNDTPDIVASAPTTELTESGGVNNGTVGTLTSFSTMTLSDRDSGDVPAFDTTALANNGWLDDGGGFWHKIGTYGTATLDTSTGQVTYGVNDNDSDTQALNNGDTVHDIFTLYVTDGTAGNSTTVDFTIHGANDNAVVGGALTGSATEAGGVNNGTAGSPATGTATDTDVDNTPNTFQAVTNGSTTNNYGTFSIDTSGHWTYTVDDSNGAVQALNVGGSLTDTFTITTQDGTTQSVTVTIQGANDAATVGGTLAGTATEAGGVSNGTAGSTATGTATDTDVDNTPNQFQQVSSGGTTHSYGSFSIDTGGNWVFTVDDNNATVQALNVGQSLTDTFTIHTTDGTAQTITVTINGANDAAVIGGTLTGSATEAGGVNNGTAGSPATGTATDTDVDNTPNTFQAVTNGSTTNHYGTFSIDTSGHWTYTVDDSNSSVQALNVGGSLTDTFTITTQDGTTQTVTVTINGANDAAVVGGAVTGTAKEAGGVNNGTPGARAAGTATDTDVDNPANMFQAVGTATTSDHGYGTWMVAGGGHWIFTVDDSNATVQALNVGQSLTDTFTIHTTDGTAQVITVTINGANDAAVIGGTLTGSATEASGVNNGTAGSPATGTATDTDVDNPNNTFQAVTNGTTTNHYGTFSIDTSGHWTYTVDDSNGAVQALNVGTSLTDTFTIHSQDGTAQTVTVTIQGANDAAVVGGTLTGSATEAGGVNNGTAGSTATGTATDTDVDNSPNQFQQVSNGGTTHGYGSFSISMSGNWVFTVDDNNATVQALNVGQSLTDTFTIHTTDGTAQTVTVTIQGANDAAVIGGTLTGSATEAGGVNNGTAGSPATGTATDTDVDNPINTFQAVTNGATANHYGTFSIDTSGHWTYTVDDSNSSVQALNVGASLTDTFTITTQDGTTQTVTVTINGANDAAVVGGAVTGTATEAGGVNNGTPGARASGTATDTDVDNPNNLFQAVGTDTASDNGYGTWVVGSGGHWIFTVDDTNATVQALNVGQSLTDTFTIHTADGTAQIITVTIQGANDAAVIGGTLTGSATEAGGVNNGTAGSPATGTATDTDVDNPNNTFQAVTNGATANHYGTFSIDTSGHWTYTVADSNGAVQALNVGMSLTDTFTIHTQDGTAQVVTVTINGANDAAVVTGDLTGSVVESNGVTGNPVATGQLVSTDPDNNALFQVVANNTATDHGWGYYKINSSGHWQFTLKDSNAVVQALNDGDLLTETFTVHTTDGTAQIISVVIHGQNEVFTGTSGADTITGTQWGDTMSGLAGDDTYVVNNTHDVVVEQVNQGTDTVQAYVTYTLSANVENLLQQGNTNIDGTGNDLANQIIGNNGNNTLSGAGGDDVIKGGNGADVLNGGAGDDNMDGGAGVDTVTYVDATAGVTVSLATTGFQNTGGAGFDKIANVENLTGSAFDDTLTGSSGRNVITGGGGADTLTGGGSSDTFVYNSASDSTVSHSDTITDLVNADAIDISAFGNDFAIVGAFDHHAHEITLSYNSTTHLTTIAIDLNGDGSADMQILANGDHHTFTNFIGLGP
jgi:VCBS repeat-containing protein